MSKGKQNQKYSLELLKSGDRAEFARVMQDNYTRVYRLGLKMLANPQDAEDILQETFIKAYQHIANFNGRSKVSTWLYKIATNEALMLIRKQKAPAIPINVPLNRNGEDQQSLKIVDWCCLPESELMSAETMEYMDKAAATLTPKLRAVFVLRDIEGLSTRQTSNVLEISESAVKTRLSRARMHLRQELSHYFSEQIPPEESA